MNGEPINCMMKNSLLFLFLFCLSFSIFAQENDLELWGSIKFSKKVSKNGKFVIEEQIRWADSISLYKKSFTNLSYEYKLHKRHVLAINLRHTQNVDNDRYARLGLDLKSEFNAYKKILFVEQRIRVQKSWNEQNFLEKYYFRAKWGLAWRNSSVSPFINQELFWDAQNSILMDKQRSTFGLVIYISSQFRMKFFVRKQRELNRNSPDHETIIGIGSHYKF